MTIAPYHKRAYDTNQLDRIPPTYNYRQAKRKGHNTASKSSNQAQTTVGVEVHYLTKKAVHA